MHTCKVVAAYAWILSNDLATKACPPRKLVALRLTYWQLVGKIIITVVILDDVGLAEEMLETSSDFTNLVPVCFDQGQDC
jgi:hypothetical protein